MHDRPRLSRETITSVASSDLSAVDFPPAKTLALPEKVAQFGTGAFLRGFAEYFIDEANRRGEFNGSVVAISSTGSSRDAMLNGQDGLFTLAIQGMEGGAARQHYRVVSSLGRALSARDEWDAVLAVARDPAIELVISNTTEVGIALDESDAFDANPPQSFPGKLTRFLAERANAFDYDARRGLVVLPCELIDDNGTMLRDTVQALARRWSLGARFDEWLENSVTFCNTLVDRIVPGVVAPDEAARLAELFGYRDGLLTACEPYALFAIEGDPALRERLGFAGSDPRIVVEPDVRPYRERKVRVLNGAHTIVAPAALLAGLETVRDACEDERVGRFLRRVILDEIVPTLDAPGAEEFAREVIDRFANPFVRHLLIDITLHAATKMRVRVVPSIQGYVRRTGRAPGWLAFGFAAYLAFMRGEIQTERRTAGLPVPEDSEGERVRLGWHAVDRGSDHSIAEFARAICADTTLWGADLGAGGFADAASEHLVRIVRHGVPAAIDVLLTEPATI
jgi:tagaturonate reductase